MQKEEKTAKIEELCKSYDRNDYPGIAIAVVDHGELIYKKGYGIANLDYDIPIDADTVFHACSMTKQFTAACIALLMEEGKLSLDQFVSSILPQWKDVGEPLTVGNLIYMVNGIPDIYDVALCVCGVREDQGISREQFWKYAGAVNWRLFGIGEKWDYGNTGYFLLGQIVEAVSGKSLSQYADEAIFKPLGMNHTFIRDDHTKIIKKKAEGYSDYHQVHYSDSYDRYTTRNDELCRNEENVEVGGAGQLWTTINDFLLWDKNFSCNRLGKQSSELIKTLTTSGVLKNGEKCGYGFGLFINEFEGRKIVHHGGWAGGYSSYYVFLPELQSSIVILGNHTNFESQIAYQCGGITDQILKVLVGKEAGGEEPVEGVMVGEPKTEEQVESVMAGDQVAKLQRESGAENVVDEVLKTQEESGLKHVLDEKLKECEGSYCCEIIDTIYEVTAIDGRLHITNRNSKNDGLNLWYNYAGEDCYLCENQYQFKDRRVIFERNPDQSIAAFHYLDEFGTTFNHYCFQRR